MNTSDHENAVRSTGVGGARRGIPGDDPEPFDLDDRQSSFVPADVATEVLHRLRTHLVGSGGGSPERQDHRPTVDNPWPGS